MSAENARKFEAAPSHDDEKELDLEDIEFVDEIEDLTDEIEELRPELADRIDYQLKAEHPDSKEDFGEKGVIAELELRKGEKRAETERGGDNFIFDAKTGLSGVLDGLGAGGKKGSDAEASALAAHLMPELFEKHLTSQEGGIDREAENTYLESQVVSSDPKLLVMKNTNPDGYAKRLGELLPFARKKFEGLPDEVRKTAISLFQATRELNMEVGRRLADTGGKTTMTVGKSVLVDGNMYEVIVNVGDSAAMKIREDGSSRMITELDTLIKNAKTMGMITDKDGNPLSNDQVDGLGGGETLYLRGNTVADPETGGPMTIGGAKRANTKAIGESPAEGIDPNDFNPSVSIDLVRPNEQVVYLSDGILDEIVDTYGNFDHKTAAEIIRSHDTPAEAAHALNEAAANIGSKNDDKALIMKRMPREFIEELSDDDIEIIDNAA